MQNELSLRLLFSSYFFFLRYTQTYPHRQINTEIHKHTHTNKPTKRERERDWCWCWLLMDQWIGAGGGDQSLWVDGNGSGCLWIGAGDGDRCLWWIANLTVRERRRRRRRRRRSYLWRGGDLTCERKEKK